MSIYIGNDLEDRLKVLETENASLKKYDLENRLKVLEIENASLKNTVNTIKWYMKSTICQTDSSFYKQSMDIDNHFK